MTSIDSRLYGVLQKRRAEDRFRSLKESENLIDFSSNDYLGFARSNTLKKKIEEELQKHPHYKNGSTGSRLLTGNTAYAEELEQWIAGFHNAEAGLIFNSGYDANTGLLSCIAGRHDVILYDELSHASIIDGIRLSLASSYKFAHNDLNDLESKLKKTKGGSFIVVESVYSMDGDLAPLNEIVSLAERHNAVLIVDEAHGTGIYGKEGKGRVCEEKLEAKVFARVHTFGKALGVHGAVVAGSKTLRNYLINYARPFIYSTALPHHSMVAIKSAYELMQTADDEKKKLTQLIKSAPPFLGEGQGVRQSPIMSVVIPGNREVKSVAAYLQEQGFDVRPILSPTVPEGKERLRICLHSFNTQDELTKLIKLIESAKSTQLTKSSQST